MSTSMEDLARLPLSRRDALKATLATVFAAGLPGIGFAAGERFGGTLVIGLGTEPRTLNIDSASDFAIKVSASPLFNKLINLKSDYTFAPELATEWSASPNGKVYTFKLRSDVKWHDGKPFTSADVKFTYDEILFKIHGIGTTVKPVVEKVETPDSQTVVFTLNKPFEVFPTFVAWQGYILPKHVYEGTSVLENPANQKPIGTGPFKFVSWTRGNQIVMERNSDYFKQDQPFLDRIVIRLIPDAGARVIALESGEIDYLCYFDLPASAIEKLRKNPAVSVVSKGHEAWASIVQLMPNFDKEPFKDLRVRRALSHAIDKKFIIEKAAFGLTKLATGPLSADIAWAYNPSVTQYAYDPAAATKLLDEAGLKPGANGIRFTTNIQTNRTNDVFVRDAQIISEQLRAVGIDAQVRALDFPAIAESVYIKRDFDLFLQSFTTGPDPFLGIQYQYISTNIRPVSITNAIGYRNPKVDELFVKAGEAPSRAERAELYKQIQAILAEDAAMVWIYENTGYSAYRADYRNLHAWSAESIYNYGDAWTVAGKTSRG